MPLLSSPLFSCGSKVMCAPDKVILVISKEVYNVKHWFRALCQTETKWRWGVEVGGQLVAKPTWQVTVCSLKKCLQSHSSSWDCTLVIQRSSRSTNRRPREVAAKNPSLGRSLTRLRASSPGRLRWCWSEYYHHWWVTPWRMDPTSEPPTRNNFPPTFLASGLLFSGVHLLLLGDLLLLLLFRHQALFGLLLSRTHG